MFGSLLSHVSSFIGDIGQLNKLGLRMMLIIAYADNSYSLTGIRGAIPVYLDYNNFQHSYTNDYSEDEVMGLPAGNPAFAKAGPQTLNCTLIFDTTGLVSGKVGELVPVSTQISLFKNVVYDVTGLAHQPHCLQLIWGRQMFKGILDSMTVNYTMFAPGGFPLRASVQATFIASQEPGFSLLSAALESPDMSHSRTAKEGIPLYQMSNEIYNDPKYYLQVAQHNGLDQFRQIKPGTQLEFPPLDKTS